MSTPEIKYTFDRAPRERHVVVAHRRGVYVPLFPKYAAVFPIGDHDEVLERVRLYAAANPEFHQRWVGWNFAAMRYDDQLMFREDGCIIRGGERV